MTTSPPTSSADAHPAAPASDLAHAPAGPPPELSSDTEKFLLALLEIQCELVGGTLGVVYLANERGVNFAGHYASPSAARVDRTAQEALSGAFLPKIERLAARVVQSRSGGLLEPATLGGGPALYGEQATHRLAAIPLLFDGAARGASVVVVADRARSGPRLSDEDLLTRLALTSARFDAFLWRMQATTEAEQRAKLREAVELLDLAQQGENAGSMASLMCHELARRFACTRVSIGLIERDWLRLAAVSGSDNVDRKGSVAEALESAMEECADQDTEIVYPTPAETENEPSQRRVTRAHAELDRKFGPSAMLSLPLRVEGDLVGVILLERDAKDPFPLQAAGLLRLIAEFIGPAVWTRRLADRGILAVTRDRVLEFGSMLVGPKYTAAKLLVAAVVLALLLAVAVPVRDTARADAEVKATVSRTIVPPFVGYLASAGVKPGDRVTAGQTIATMDARDLEKQIAQATAHAAALSIQRDEASGQGDLAKQRIAEAQLQENDAQLASLRDRLAQCAITSPIAGTVGRGELDPLLGARVEPTQALYEVVTDERTVVVAVRERDVHRVKERLDAAAAKNEPFEGELTLKARPGESLTLRAKRLQPMAEVVRGENVYLLECELVALDAERQRSILPGVTGIARMRTGWTTTAIRVLRPLVDELRMKWWW